jgi:uncharacterized protein YndB with AHSA1/START domain
MSAASTVTHATFAIRRHYPKPAKKVFAALSDKAKKQRWQVEGEGFVVESFEMDFRVGGRESSSFRQQGGPLIKMDAVYQDIVNDSRIVFAYSMFMEGKALSASLATFELLPTDKGTDVIFTEQGAYYEGGQDFVKAREEGSKVLMEALAKELDRAE